MPNPKLKLLQESIIAGNIPQLVMNMISFAIDSRSSDIHVEPEKNTVRIRYRVDGVLREIVEYPLNIHPAVVSRIKIMSNLKIDEQRIPQDGRCHVSTEDNREMDLRISIFPTVNGEKAVMRIQEEAIKIPTLEDLGLEGNSLESVIKGINNPNGIVLTTGPTGSGKTTTLYSCLQIVNKPEVNILTLEDPVEIQIDGLNQSQVYPDIEYTFATGLRSALRQDPDIVMVGEIRDRETVDIAIEASLTGHLVLSTLHTNSAIDTLIRIENMGTPMFLVTSTVNAIIAQRLVRKICQKCKEKYQPDDRSLEMVKKTTEALAKSGQLPAEAKDNLVVYRGKGCEECDGIGYHGRLGLFEVLDMKNNIKDAILQKVPSREVEKLAIENGMTTLEQSGVLKALKGETTLEEVYRVARHVSD